MVITLASIVAVVLSGILSLVIGFVWYGPLFAKAWQKEVGLTDKDLEKGPGAGFLMAFLMAVVSSSVLVILSNLTGTTGLVNGAILGLLTGLGFAATSLGTNYIFAQRSFKLFLIDAGYMVVYIIIAGAVVGVIR